MSRFITGDEQGNLKILRYPGKVVETEPGTEKKPGSQTESKTAYAGTNSGQVQCLSIGSRTDDSSPLLAAAYSDGTTSTFTLDDEDTVKLSRTWKENRLRADQTYVGLKVAARGIYSCTSNGALRMTPHENDGEPSNPLVTLVPTRLCGWRLGSDQQTFAYGGDEVELSVWDTEKAFSQSPEELSEAPSAKKKRKRSDALFPAEVWRAKNVPNDHLGLRQPVRITALTYLSDTPSTSQHHLLTGTQFGDVRRYDTRAARRPVSNWKNLGKVDGVKVVEKGFSEHEVFVGDHGSNLLSVDLRNGAVVYGYRGLAGGISSIAPSPTVLVSTSLDRYARIHSTVPPPPEAGQRQERKGEVLDKVYVTSIPTVVVWDQNTSSSDGVKAPAAVVDDAVDDDLWENMDIIGEDESEEPGRRRKKANLS